MYRKLLIGYAADRHGDDALALGRLLASRETVEEVLVVEMSRESAHATENLTAGWPPRVRVSSHVVSGSSPAHALSSAMDDEQADVLVLGSTHRGFTGRLLAGTTAGSIFPEARWPVVIAPPGYAEESPSVRKIAVAYDGSKQSEAALSWAVTVASAFSAAMRLVAVVEPPPPPVETWGAGVPAETWDSGFTAQQSIEAFEAMREGMRRELGAARESVAQGEVETVVLEGDPRVGLREAAEDADMLVVGSHGSGRVAGALMRSVSRGLAHSCPVPLAVVPAGVREEASPSPSRTAHPA